MKSKIIRKRNARNNALLSYCKDTFNKNIYTMALDIMNQAETTLDEAEANLVSRISGFYNGEAWETSCHLRYLRLMGNPVAAWHMCDDEEYAEVTRERVITVLKERLEESGTWGPDHRSAAAQLGTILRPAPCCAHVSFLNQIGAL